MSHYIRFIAVVAASICLIIDANAGPREDFQQALEQLQKGTSDSGQTERVIRLAQELKPTPTIPEEARQHFVEGNFIAKSAKDVAGQKLAVESYKEALKIAPWWGDAYYNLAVAQELVDELDDAKSSLRLYILTRPGEREVRDAQDHIYTLNAKQKISAQSKISEDVARKEQITQFPKNLEGAIWMGDVIDVASEPPHFQRRFYIVKNGRLVKKNAAWGPGFHTQREPDPSTITSELISIELTSPSFSYNGNGTDIDQNCNPIAITIEEFVITEQYLCYGGKYGPQVENKFRRQR